jgi:uncharacterized protein YbjT (DUF2867 family)
MIAITGGTGFVGRHLVRALADHGQPVRLLLNEKRADALDTDPRLAQVRENVRDVVIGSVLNDEALFRLTTGAHVVIHLENAQWWGGSRDLERVELAGTRNLIIAARAARVGRLITLSHLGAAPASAYPLLRVKGQVEDLIRSSGLAYTILRSGLAFGSEDAFINHLAMQLRANPLIFLRPGRGEVVLHPIFVEDLVGAIVGSLNSLDSVDHTIEIGGAEYITVDDLIRTVMRVSGSPRAVIGVPPYLLRWLTRVFDRILPRSLITPQWMDILAANRTARIGNLHQHFGIRPRRLEDTLLTYMRGRHYSRAMLRYTFRRRPQVL